MKMFAFKRRHSSLLVLALALFIVSTATLALAANGSPQPMCGSKEVFRECKIASEPSCKDLTPRRCVKDRKGACFCKNGLVRDGNGRCVLEEFCRVKPVQGQCGKHQVFSNLGGDCDPFCGNPFRICFGNPKGGCICKPGFVRETLDGDRCVPLESCPGPVKTGCDENEVFSHGGAACQSRCDRPSLDCPGTRVSGCVCKPGFMRKSIASDLCVRKESCDVIDPQTGCGENQVFSARGAGCQSTCDNPIRICSLVPVHGCVCKAGFVRKSLKDDRCVPEESCDILKRCEENEVFSHRKSCQPRCDAPRNPLDCITGIPSRRECICKPGFVLKSFEEPTCVPKESCPIAIKAPPPV